MSGEQIEKPKEGDKVTRFQAENIAIHSLERAGFTQNDIYGDNEVKAAVEQFGKEHEGETFTQAEQAAIAYFEEKKASEFQKEVAPAQKGEVQQIEPMEVTGKVDPWAAAIDARARGEKPKPFEELSPEQQQAVREAEAEARAATEEKMEARRQEYGLPKPSEPQRPDMELSRELIAEQREKAEQRAEFAKRNPQLTPGTEEFRLAMRQEEIGGSTAVAATAEPETELAKAEPSEEIMDFTKEEPVQVAVAPKKEEEIVPISEEEMVFAENETGVLSTEEEDFLKQRIPAYVNAFEELGKEREFEDRVEMGNRALDQIDAMKNLRAEFVEKYPESAANFDKQVEDLNALAKECAGITPREGAVVAQAEPEGDMMEFTEEETGLFGPEEVMDFTTGEEDAEVAVAPKKEVAPLAQQEAEPEEETMEFTEEELYGKKQEEPEEVAVAPTEQTEAPAEDVEAEEEVMAVSSGNVEEAAETEAERLARIARASREGGSQRRSGERAPVAVVKTDLATMENKEVINIVESKAGERPDMLRGDHQENMARLDSWMQGVASTAQTLGVTQGELVNRYDAAKKAEPKSAPAAPAAEVAQVEEVAAEEEEAPVTTAPKAEPEIIAPTPVEEVAVVEEAPEETAPAVAQKSLYEQGKNLSMGDFAPWYLALSQEEKDQYNREKSEAKKAQEEIKPAAPTPAAELNPELAAQMEMARKGEIETHQETSGPRKGVESEAVEIGALSVGGGDREVRTAGPGEERKITTSLPPKREVRAAEGEFSLVWKPSEEEARILSSKDKRAVGELLSAYDTELKHSQRKVEIRTAPGAHVKEDDIKAAQDEVTYYQSAVDQIRKNM